MTQQPALEPAHLDADLERDLATLRDIADLAVDTFRILHTEIAAAPTPPEHREASASAAERLTRAVRRTIHLRQHLRQNALTATAERTAARAHIIRRVEDTIDREASARPGRVDPDALRVELHDRLETLEFDHELRTRPVKETITDILHDLGLDRIPGLHPRPRRTPADLRTLNAQAAAAPNPAPRKVGFNPPPQPDLNPPPKPEPPRIHPEKMREGRSLLDHLLRER